LLLKRPCDRTPDPQEGAAAELMMNGSLLSSGVQDTTAGAFSPQ
jgi:hypothetical protein